MRMGHYISLAKAECPTRTGVTDKAVDWVGSVWEALVALASTDVVYGVPDPGVTVMSSSGVLP
jgi:hypothetical protein